MLSNVKNGWCDFNYGSFIGHPSYLTDVVIDLIDLFYDGEGVVRCDEEGTEFDIVLSDIDFYIVDFKEHLPKVYQNEDKSIKEYIQEFIEDVERDIDDWAKWTYEDYDYFQIDMRKNLISFKLRMLKDKYK